MWLDEVAGPSLPAGHTNQYPTQPNDQFVEIGNPPLFSGSQHKD